MPRTGLTGCFSPNRLRIAISLAFFSTSCLADSFGQVSPPPGYRIPDVAAMSADGSIFVGMVSQGPFTASAVRWSNYGGSNDLLPGPGGAAQSYASGISADGSVIVGGIDIDGTSQAVVWTNNRPLRVLDNLPGTAGSVALGVSAGGQFVVGSSSTVDTRSDRAVLWRLADNTQVDLSQTALLRSPEVTDSRAIAVSRDGDIVAGNYSTADNNLSFIWRSGTNTSQQLALLAAGGYTNSDVVGISANGARIAGTLTTDDYRMQAVYWTSADGAVHGIGTLGLNGDRTFSHASAISANGQVIVGDSDFRAFRWSQTDGMQSVAQWLAAAKVAIGDRLVLQRATATNKDGSVIVGWGMDERERPITWIARVSPIGSGFLPNRDAYMATLQEAAGKTPQPVSSAANLALGGAHHRSLLDSGLAVTQNGACAWATADASHHNATDSSVNLVEAGACKDIGATRIGVGVGQAWSRQGWGLGGGARYNGQYVLAEVASDLGRGIEVSLLGYYGRFAANLRRNYLNGIAIDTSRGTPDATSSSLRLRTDWKDAFTLAATRFSPYAAYTWMDTRMDGYTETGGGFPARFAAATQRSQDIRLGLAAKTPLAASTDLRIAAEAAHRIDETLSGTSSEVIGLDSFTIPGQKANKNWTRLLVDLDHRIGKSSLINLSASAATSGGDASWGASLGYRMAF